MQQNLSLFDRRVRNLFLALILAGANFAVRADEPPACAWSDPPAQCNPADDLPLEVDPWEDDLPGKHAATGDGVAIGRTPSSWDGALARLLETARRLVQP